MTHYLEALRNRLAEVGVHVCTIKPGFVDTAMTEGKHVFWLISPETAARTILSAARRRVNTRYVPLRWMAVMTAVRLIPSAIFRHLSF
jgi:short-subunit dehydrogenase